MNRKDPLWLTLSIFAYFFTICLLAFFLATQAKAGGNDPEEMTVLMGGDCYAFTDYPTSQNAARILKERGWRPMPLNKKLVISELVRKKRAEVLYITDTFICGPFLGQMKVYHTWYWRVI